MKIKDLDTVSVMAPATVGNAAVGFDVLGFALDGVGDEITLTKSKPGIKIEMIQRANNPENNEEDSISTIPEKNTAGVALQKFLEATGDKSIGFTMQVKKGIPLCSGMGGSAASAVGAVVAANAFLEKPFSDKKLLYFALHGESVSSGSPHIDNIAPCLMGGLTLAQPLSRMPETEDSLQVERVLVPKGIQCVLVHPHMRIPTREARNMLKKQAFLSLFVQQSAFMTSFVLGCERGDLDLIRRNMMDVLIEPQRSRLIPGFNDAKAAAMASGALGFSISGSGPSVFAWVENAKQAEDVKGSIQKAFENQNIKTDAWISPVSEKGARIL